MRSNIGAPSPGLYSTISGCKCAFLKKSTTNNLMKASTLFDSPPPHNSTSLRTIQYRSSCAFCQLHFVSYLSPVTPACIWLVVVFIRQLAAAKCHGEFFYFLPPISMAITMWQHPPPWSTSCIPFPPKDRPSIQQNPSQIKAMSLSLFFLLFFQFAAQNNEHTFSPLIQTGRISSSTPPIPSADSRLVVVSP